MAKQGTKTATPRLRFPQFRSSSGFNSTPLSRAFLRITNGKANAQDHVEDGAFPLFDRSEVVKASNEFIFSAEAVILPGEGMAFRPRYFEGRFNLHQRAYALMECQGHAKFFFYALDYAKGALALKAVKSTVLSLRLPIIENFVVYAPEPTEQQKIADCLTSLDEVIAAQGRKVEALKAHKRGLMQQLFPREGETRPRLRFPEFRDAPEWEDGRVADTMPFVTSGSRGWAAYYADTGSLFVRITNLSRSSIFLDLSDSKFVALPPEATEGVRTQLKVDDVLISITADTGIVGYVDGSVPSPAYINQHIALVRFDGSKVLGRFAAYFLASEVSQRQFRGSTDSGAKAGMNLLAVQSMKLQLPALAEQHRIADCLTSVDTQITAESHQLAALKTHKQGLMQQLFPAPEAAHA